ncbi:hypothetical protein WG915_08870 [Corynebacterium sp. H128]|uniref:hypothetical protein n=1 Tax=Corynebacterium sp. H128 TaxID=3133427 RepID=UPI0030B5E407
MMLDGIGLRILIRDSRLLIEEWRTLREARELCEDGRGLFYRSLTDQGIDRADLEGRYLAELGRYALQCGYIEPLSLNCFVWRGGERYVGLRTLDQDCYPGLLRLVRALQDASEALAADPLVGEILEDWDVVHWWAAQALPGFNDPKWLSEAQACQLVWRGRSTLKRWRLSGKVRSKGEGAQRLYAMDDLVTCANNMTENQLTPLKQYSQVKTV